MKKLNTRERRVLGASAPAVAASPPVSSPAAPLPSPTSPSTAAPVYGKTDSSSASDHSADTEGSSVIEDGSLVCPICNETMVCNRNVLLCSVCPGFCR